MKMFGKTLSTTLIAALAMSGISMAALVAYLSNSVTANVSVSSPMELQISTDGVTWDDTNTVTLSDIYGGESTTVWVKTKNLADADITGTMENIVENLDGVTCSDFTVAAYDTGINPAFDEIDTTASIACTSVDSTHVRIQTTPTEPWTWGANHEDNGRFVITFSPYATGTYTLTSQVI